MPNCFPKSMHHFSSHQHNVRFPVFPYLSNTCSSNPFYSSHLGAIWTGISCLLSGKSYFYILITHHAICKLPFVPWVIFFQVVDTVVSSRKVFNFDGWFLKLFCCSPFGVVPKRPNPRPQRFMPVFSWEFCSFNS